MRNEPLNPEQPRYDFGVIREEFDSLRIAMGNNIDREWRSRRQARVEGGLAVVRGLYHGSENTLGAIRFLMADTPASYARKREYAIAASPLCRSILDALCTLVFIFGDFEERVKWYYKAGWRELVEETVRLENAYGSDPAWNEPLADRKQMIEMGEAAFELTAVETADHSKIKRWPIPDRMLAVLPKGSDRHEYLRYMLDWFYRTLSQEAHHSWSGLARSYVLLIMGQISEEDRLHHLELLRTRQVNMSLTLMMAIITELELELKFGLNERAKYVWSVLRGWSDDARDVYDRFYRPILGTASTETP